MELTVNNVGVTVQAFCGVFSLLFQRVRVPEFSVVLYAVVDPAVDTSGRHF